MYAAITFGTWSGEKSWRICVAPVAITFAGLISGLVEPSVEIILLMKADCAAEMPKAPPMVWKTKFARS